MNIQDSVVLVTGANRGLGLAFAKTLIERGARKVYAPTRDAGTVTLPGVVPVRLDVTDAAQVADVAKTSPHAVAAQTLDTLEAGGLEVLVDDITRNAEAGRSVPHCVYHRPAG